MAFNQESFDYTNRLNNSYSFQDTNPNLSNDNNNQPQNGLHMNSISSNNIPQFQNSASLSFDSDSNPQQQQYLLQLQIQEAQAQLQAQQAQLQNNSFSQQKRAYSIAYPLYNHQQYTNNNESINANSQANDMFIPSNLNNNLPNKLQDFSISPHTSISSSNTDSLLSSSTQLNNQLMSQPRVEPFQSQLASMQNQQQFQSQAHFQNQMQNKNQLNSENSSFFNNVNGNINNSNFNLPIELQGGVNNIFNRRPSYAADVQSNQNNLESNLINNKINLKQYALQYNHLNNKRNSLYENARGSIDYASSFTPQNNSSKPNNIHSISSISSHSSSNSSLSLGGNNRSISDIDTIYVKLDDGLLLNKATNTIITSPELKKEFEKCSIYFGSFDIAMNVVDQLNNLLNSPTGNKPNGFMNTSELFTVQKRIDKLLEFLLKQNDDLKSSTHMGNKNYSLILNKNGRLDIISFPKNSNLQLMQKDLIIIEGDRGKDLVMVLKPIIEFKFALFFNYLKKKLHLKSLEFGNDINRKTNTDKSKSFGNRNANQAQQKSIINEDENFITLPNKQILRFAKPHELNQLILKYNDEIMAYRICLNYSASLNLNLIIKNVEFQFDKKKLIIYYYCLQRLDFRGLIKELFKIYKTRIWLCAILPLEKNFKPLLDYELEKRDIKIDDVDKLISSSFIKESTSNSSSISTDSVVDPLTVPKSSLGTNNITPPPTASSNGNFNNDPNPSSYRSDSNVVTDKFPKSDQIYQFNEINDPIYFHCKIFSNLINMFYFEILNKDLFPDRYWFLEDESST